MTAKQIVSNGLTTQGWNKLDELLGKSNQEQLRLILTKIIERLPADQITIKYNEFKNNGEE